MGDLRLKSSDGLLWKDNKIFTGSITSYPVELFISAIESEARTLNDSQEQMCQNAWNRISEGKSSPSGVWKAKMQEKYNDKSSFLWNDMKKDLLEAFGRTDFAYTFEEKFEFLLSLTRGERESLTAYLSRVEWVMNSPLAYTAGDTSWMKMIFLLGLQEEDQLYFLDKICSDEYKKLKDVIRETLDDKHYITSGPYQAGAKEESEDVWVKEEDEIFDDDSGEAYDPALLEVDYIPGDDLDEEVQPLAKKKRKRKLGQSGKNDGKTNGLKMKKARVPRGVRKLRGCITCGIDKTLTQEQWDEHEAKFHLGKCDLCMLSFDNLEGMRRHHKERHQTKSAICPKCNLPQKRHLIDHVPCKFKDGINPKEENKVLDDPPKKVTGGSKFVRTTDRPTMKTREAVHTHLLKEGEDPDTFKTFTSHLLKVESSGLSRWFCSFCRIEFPAKKFLNKHTMTVHKGKKYYCDLCPLDETLMWKQLDFCALHKFRKHNVLVPSYQPLQCTKCTYQNVLECPMRDHMRKKHPEDEGDLQCKICNKKLTTMAGLRGHIEVQHMKVYKFQCDQCDETFATSLARKRHKMETHGPDVPGSRNYVCNVCGARLKNEITLKAHIKLTHEMPEAKCKLCDKMFKNKYDLKRHNQEAHIKDKKFKCTICPDSAFHQKKILYDHCMYHHVKIKPYVCAVCGAEYWQKPIMGAHIAESHENWPKDKAKAEWKYLLREKPHLWKQIPIASHIKRVLGEDQ